MIFCLLLLLPFISCEIICQNSENEIENYCEQKLINMFTNNSLPINKKLIYVMINTNFSFELLQKLKNNFKEEFFRIGFDKNVFLENMVQFKKFINTNSNINIRMNFNCSLNFNYNLFIYNNVPYLTYNTGKNFYYEKQKIKNYLKDYLSKYNTMTPIKSIYYCEENIYVNCKKC